MDVEKSHAEAEKLKSKFHTQDGTKLYFKDGSWLLVRKSGTEPMARIYFEAIEGSAMAAVQKSKLHLAPDKDKHIQAAVREDMDMALAKSNRMDRAIKALLTQQFGVPLKEIETKIGPNLKDS